MVKVFDKVQNREYSSCRKLIQAQAGSFSLFIDKILAENKAKDLVKCVSGQVPLYVFSGIIRNFLLGYLNNRDLDLVAVDSNIVNIPHSLLKDVSISKNKFNGYKLVCNGLTIDWWDVDRTWGILQERMKGTAYSLLNTAFFNFSAIVYDYNNRRFLISEDFCKFLSTHTMEIVYAKNPRIDTCIINSLYYADHYEFAIGNSLRKWIVKNYNDNLDFERAQMSRFQKVVYPNEMIHSFAILCSRADIYKKGTIRFVGKGKDIVLRFAN